jgi:hypothetical protein
MRCLIFGIIFFLFLPLPVLAIPQFSNPIPKNGVYITGGAEYLFSINIKEENLNVSSVKLNIGSSDDWPSNIGILQMNCFNFSLSDWICNKTVLIAVAESGTKEFFFFEASDLSGNYNSLGNLTYPLEVIIDRTPPTISPYGFKNMSYISTNKPIRVRVEDLYSGVNVSSVFSLVGWFYGNETWNSTWKPMIYENETGLFRADWDTSQLPNNSSWFFYVNASDNVGNINVTNLGIVLIDNEYPQIEIISPTQNQKVFGSLELKVFVKDVYSGVGSVFYNITSEFFSGSLSCLDSLHESNCSALFDTTKVSDGVHIINFIASDNTGNQVNKSVEIEVNNLYPVITLVTPQNNSYVHGLVDINVSVKNARQIIDANIQFENLGISEQKTLYCQNFSCFYKWNTNEEKDGDYIIRIKVTNEVNYQTTLVFYLKVDNTKPIIAITLPEGKISGNASFQLVATDENGINSSSAIIRISNLYREMSCSIFVQGKKAVCVSIFDSTTLANNKYTITFSIRDLAGNEINESKEIEIFNFLTKEEETKEKTEKTEEEKEIQRNETQETKKWILPTIELIGKIHFIFIPIIAGILLLLFLTPLLLRKKEEISDSTIKKLESEKKDLKMIQNYLLAISRASDNLMAKEYVYSLSAFLDGLSDVSFSTKKFYESLKTIPKIFATQLIEKYSERFEGAEKSRAVLKEIKKYVEEAIKIEELNEVKEICNKAYNLTKEFQVALEKEILLWKEFVSDFRALEKGKK